jgi:hypothetical protein
MTQQPPAATGRLLSAVGYFVLFFAAMTLSGILFLAGGIALVLIPGSLPLWAKVGYVLVGIVGSVGIALLATRGALNRRTRQPGHGDDPASTTRSRWLGWFAGIAGTIVAAAGSAIVTALVSNWLER